MKTKTISGPHRFAASTPGNQRIGIEAWRSVVGVLVGAQETKVRPAVVSTMYLGERPEALLGILTSGPAHGTLRFSSSKKFSRKLTWTLVDPPLADSGAGKTTNRLPSGVRSRGG